MAGRDSGRDSLSWRMAEEGTGSVPKLAGLGENPLGVREGVWCMRFVVRFVFGACRLGCFAGVEDSCFA